MPDIKVEGIRELNGNIWQLYEAINRLNENVLNLTIEMSKLNATLDMAKKQEEEEAQWL